MFADVLEAPSTGLLTRPPAPIAPAVTAPEPIFILIRQKIDGDQAPETLGPSWIIVLERETPKSLVGFLLDENGKRDVMRISIYDRRPNGVGERLEPGRFDKRREIARFDSFEQARRGLVAARAGWDSARSCHLAALREVVADRKTKLLAERDRLHRSVTAALGPMTSDLNIAVLAVTTEAARVIERRNALMIEAIKQWGAAA